MDGDIYDNPDVTLHEDGIEMGGLPLDINPVSVESSTLKEYMESAEKYLGTSDKVKGAGGENTEPERIFDKKTERIHEKEFTRLVMGENGFTYQ